jgi:inorganic pyrophosphatase
MSKKNGTRGRLADPSSLKPVDAEDGDPIDVLVLMDEPAFPGCVLNCRPIGVIEGEQTAKNKKEPNDRIIAVEQDAHSGLISTRSMIWARTSFKNLRSSSSTTISSRAKSVACWG